MPIYEYECTKCGHITEAWQKFSDPPLSKCQHCKGKMRKLISQSSFHLKGTGWYVTDYASKKGASGEKKEAKPSKPAKETKGSGEKAEAKSSSNKKKGGNKT
jgi:putative FmdB family regulatory protein